MDLFAKQTQTITQLTRQIKTILENGFYDISLEGEISNCKSQVSGHIYLTLKDESAQLPAVIWRSSVPSLSVRPTDGMKVIVEGSLTVYEPHGRYQFVIKQMKLSGVGELQKAFERLKEKLFSEGLFDTIHKKILPEYPEKIGIITSPTGAAIQDLTTVITRRMPMVQLFLFPAKVQGAGSAEEIAGGIRFFNEDFRVDVLIVGRGGGSLEDLWAFNEEIVARAIFNSEIPIISAVGHEIDFTISDFVADVRAATPSMAGEIVVKDKPDVVAYVSGISMHLSRIMNQEIANLKSQVNSYAKSYALNKPIELVRFRGQKLDDLNNRLTRSFQQLLSVRQTKIQNLKSHLEAFNPQGVLKRGYAMVRSGEKAANSVHQISPKSKINITFHDGSVNAEVE